MRLNKKYKILKLIDTIEEGIDYAENNSLDKAKGMFTECIDALIYLSSIIEENKMVVEIIEDIINKIKSSFKLINNCNPINNEVRSVKRIINELRYIIINEIDTQIEIAFMPYKVSMWDSLESIWEACNSDSDCSCYVVPIPYYEKDAQGNLINVCYEGSDFPKDIEVTPYNLYDLENREPDIIYIHNPYDGYNFLTMVDNRYFSSNLSKYTNMMVYVPYFASGSYKNKEEHGAFSMFPGPINATKIIAQSSIDKQLYIDNGYNPNKILNLGSPKFDSVLLACKKDIEIPEEWMEVIKDKKVFLLNTTIDDILSDINWIDSLEKILACFIDNDSCCVIWRPHPLTDITLKTMRPDLVQGYNQLKNKVFKHNNIIIDTTSNVYRSIKISHALISGNSSIMFEYALTGKPILSFMRNELFHENRFYCMDYLGNYFTNKGTSVNSFINMVLNNEDPKKEERIIRLKNSVINIDGTCGKKIHENIKDEVLNSMLKYLKRY